MSGGSNIKNHAYLLFLMITSLGCSIYSVIIFKHNSLREELSKSRNCNSIYIYLLAITFFTASLGIYLLGFLSYKWLCQTVCYVKTSMGFSLTRFLALILYLGLNTMGYYLVFFHLDQECKNYLNNNKNIQGVYLSFLVSFGLILMWSIYRIVTSGCKREQESHLLISGASASKEALENQYGAPESIPDWRIQGNNIRYVIPI